MILHAITWHDHEASCTSHCLRLHVLGGQQEKRKDWEIFLGTLKNDPQRIIEGSECHLFSVLQEFRTF